MPSPTKLEQTKSDALFQEGVFIGNYRLGSLIAQGGMGSVYKATHRILSRTAAIKIVRSDVAEVVAAREGLLREANILSRITHDGIARVWDAGVLADGRPWMAMELLEGESLGELLLRRSSLRAREVVAILRALVNPLEVAHRAGVVHRDLKPENILLRQDDNLWRVRLIDWGIAHELDRPELHGTIAAGTPYYMAPEQVRGEPVDGRTDVYALGVIAYELLTGLLPFSGDTPSAIAMAQVRQAPPKMVDTAIPTTLTALVYTMLAKSPAGRPTLEAVRIALESIFDENEVYEIAFTFEDVPKVQPSATEVAAASDSAPAAPKPRWTPTIIPMHARDTRRMGRVGNPRAKAKIAGVVNPRKTSSR